jgi:hypothetical protein
MALALIQHCHATRSDQNYNIGKGAVVDGKDPPMESTINLNTNDVIWYVLRSTFATPPYLDGGRQVFTVSDRSAIEAQ